MADGYGPRSAVDGFDNSDPVQAHDDQKKRFWADIWFLLSIFFVGIFLVNGYKHVRELWLVENGECIEADFYRQEMRASYQDEHGNKFYSFDVSGFFPVTDGGRICLYYTDEILEARPQNVLVFWIACYVLFGALSAFCIWRVYIVYGKKRK